MVRDIPSVYPATWVFPCFNKAEFRHFKELTPAVSRSESFDPTLLKKNWPHLVEERGRAAPRYHADASGGFQRATPLLLQPLPLC